MTSTITALSKFQLHYLFQLIDNIPESRLYEKQLSGYNSAGWILGHIFVEAEDLLTHLNVKHEQNEFWNSLFKYSAGKITSLENLPTKLELKNNIQSRYAMLIKLYEELSEEERESAHPSVLIRKALPNLDAWFAHHLTTHLSIHCGNLVVWKKMIGLEVNGY